MKKIFQQGMLMWMVVLVTSVTFAAPVTEQQIQRVYYQWTHAIESARGNPQPVVSLYAPKAISLATLAPLPLTNHAQLDAYFKKLTSNKGLHVETQQILTQIYPHIAINSGVYTFHFIDSENKPVALKARFSFVYHESKGRWLIVNHHSSVLPNPGS
ncbi:MAG: SgcJ/EcaC family oxidoreductase [Proteobacteria bacterium]|nr:SgcJ/EcaC family oxidoreductase [Pseudomonadota bacterium]